MRDHLEDEMDHIICTSTESFTMNCIFFVQYSQIPFQQVYDHWTQWTLDPWSILHMHFDFRIQPLVLQIFLFKSQMAVGPHPGHITEKKKLHIGGGR